MCSTSGEDGTRVEAERMEQGGPGFEYVFHLGRGWNKEVRALSMCSTSGEDGTRVAGLWVCVPPRERMEQGGSGEDGTRVAGKLVPSSPEVECIYNYILSEAFLYTSISSLLPIAMTSTSIISSIIWYTILNCFLSAYIFR